MQTLTTETQMDELYYEKEIANMMPKRSLNHDEQCWNYMLNLSIQNITFHRTKQANI